MCIVSGEWSYDGPHACGFVELEDRGFIEHDWNWLLDWLVVRQGLARRIYMYGAADAGLILSRTLERTPQGARRKQRCGFRLIGL
jgi:hypothetical protein